MPEYLETVGHWLQEAKDSAQYDLETATLETFQKAQGAYGAVQSILDQIKRTLHAAEKAAEKLQQKNTKENSL